MRAFSQVDVFGAEPMLGNPVAVVHDGSGLDAEQMLRFTRWTNLSEATFLLPPTDPAADYAVRIFTPAGELPFAGHPTLGTCHAWLAAGGRPRADAVVQECGAGLVPVRQQGDLLAFAAPARADAPDRWIQRRSTGSAPGWACGPRTCWTIGGATTDRPGRPSG